MKLLLTIKEQDVTPNAKTADNSKFRKRKAVRAVVQDENGGIHLLKVGLHNYHKLPGGGIEDGEGIKDALVRELLEEIGCKAEVIDEVGSIVEYRDQFKLIQTSYCYLAKQVGRQKDPLFTEHEISEGFRGVKAKNIDEAIMILEQDKPNNYEGCFIKIRDSKLLKSARELLKQ